MPHQTPTDSNALLEAWRRNRSTLLANTLQRLEHNELGAQLKKIKRSVVPWTSELEAIRALPDDPRVTVFLTKCLLKPTWPGSSAKAVVELICHKLIELRDARPCAALREAARTPPAYLGAAYTETVQALLADTCRELEAVCAQLPVDDEATAVLAASVATLEPMPAAGFFGKAQANDATLDAVWKDPFNESLRLVAADALLERADPRGEFITLQLQIARGSAPEGAQKKCDALLRKHASDFAGPLAAISTRDWVFEGGFLAVCPAHRSMVGRRFWEEALPAPHWATVTEVRFGRDTPGWFITRWLAEVPHQHVKRLCAGPVGLVKVGAPSGWRVETYKINRDGRIDGEFVFHALWRAFSPEQRAAVDFPSPEIRQLLTDRLPKKLR